MRERQISSSMLFIRIYHTEVMGALRNGTSSERARVRGGFLEEKAHWSWWGRNEEGLSQQTECRGKPRRGRATSSAMIGGIPAMPKDGNVYHESELGGIWRSRRWCQDPSSSSATPVVPDNQRLLHISSVFIEACSQGNTRPLQYPCITHFLMDSLS